MFAELCGSVAANYLVFSSAATHKESTQTAREPHTCFRLNFVLCVPDGLGSRIVDQYLQTVGLPGTAEYEEEEAKWFCLVTKTARRS